MTVSKAQQKAVSKYMKENYDEIKIRVPKGFKEGIRSHAESQDESVNSFIKRAITEVREMDIMHRAYQRALLRYLEEAKEALDSNDLTEANRILSELIEATKADL